MTSLLLVAALLLLVLFLLPRNGLPPAELTEKDLLPAHHKLLDVEDARLVHVAEALPPCLYLFYVSHTSRISTNFPLDVSELAPRCHCSSDGCRHSHIRGKLEI